MNDPYILIETWNIFKDIITDARKDDAALSLVNIYIDSGTISYEDVDTLRGEDPHIDNAIDEVYGSNVFEDYEEYDDYGDGDF